MQLESRFQEQSEKKERLSAEVSKLRSEAIGLKNEVLKHVACGDKSVSRHLERSVMSIANSGASPELVSVAGGAGAGVDADSTTSLPDAVWPLAQVTSPPGCQNEGLFDQQIVGSPGPKPRQDSWGSMESMLSDELSMDDCFNDLVNI